MLKRKSTPQNNKNRPNPLEVKADGTHFDPFEHFFVFQHPGAFRSHCEMAVFHMLQDPEKQQKYKEFKLHCFDSFEGVETQVYPSKQ